MPRGVAGEKVEIRNEEDGTRIVERREKTPGRSFHLLSRSAKIDLDDRVNFTRNEQITEFEHFGGFLVR